MATVEPDPALAQEKAKQRQAAAAKAPAVNGLSFMVYLVAEMKDVRATGAAGKDRLFLPGYREKEKGEVTEFRRIGGDVDDSPEIVFVAFPFPIEKALKRAILGVFLGVVDPRAFLTSLLSR